MPLRRLSFSDGKQTRCHLNCGATQTSPPFQNPSAKKVPNVKSQALRGWNRVPGTGWENKDQNLRGSAGLSAVRSPATRSRPFRSGPPSLGSRATGRASTRARGFEAYPRRHPLARAGSGGSSDSVPSPPERPELAAECRRRFSAPGVGGLGADREDGEDREDGAVAAAAEAVAAPPPPAWSNRRGDASSDANAGPNRRPAAARP